MGNRHAQRHNLIENSRPNRVVHRQWQMALISAVLQSNRKQKKNSCELPMPIHGSCL